MNLYHYDYINGDELGYWQYVYRHHPSRHSWFWHFKYSSKSSWIKKYLFFNLSYGFFILILFLACYLFGKLPLFFVLVPIVMGVPWWFYDCIRSYYYAFVKPADIETALQDFAEVNGLEVTSKPTLDRFMVRKDEYVFELSYAYDDIWIRDMFNRKNVIVLKACYKTTDQTLINQHGLVTLPFERKFNEYCATLAPDNDILLDEHQICAVYPVGTPQAVTGRAASNLIDVLTHFCLIIVSPTFESASHYIAARPVSAKNALFHLLLAFVLFSVYIYSIYNRHAPADDIQKSVPIQTIPNYYLSQNGVKLSRYEPDTLLFYATITYNTSNERGTICVTIDDETLSDTALDTLGYYRMHNMVILVSASQGLSSDFIEPVIGTNVLSGLPPISLMINQSDSISFFRSDYYLNDEGRIRDRKSYNE